MKNTKSLAFLGFVALFCAAAQPLSAANFIVTQTSFVFTPSSMNIAQGDSVTWTNKDPLVTHSSASGTPPASPNGLWNGTNHPGGTYTVDFTGFAPGNYPYYCTFHGGPPLNMVGSITVTNATLAPPSVSITNPTDGTRFAAPANIALTASATQVGGTITNVQFFSGASLSGSVSSSPYNFAVNNASAGNYAFTAVAMNNLGAAATSAVVNVFVETNAILSSPLFVNGQFQLTVNGIAGQTYATESSSNLVNWSAISTNLAPSNSFNVVDPSPTNAALRFYRARQDL
ncbi:MAG: Ig-like domain-containing protein [Verrucomicrobiota bacterium]|jgi:plastocyanin